MNIFSARTKGSAHRHLFNDLMPYILIFSTLLILLISMGRFYLNFTRPNVELKGKTFVFFYIPSNSSYPEVKRELLRKGYIRNIKTFNWSAQRMNYMNRVKAGKYKILEGMSNRALLQMLRAGHQEAVKVTINGARTPGELAGKIGHLLEADSSSFMKLFTNSSFLARYHVTPQTSLSLFIPDTYHLYWNTSADQFFQRMYKEYLKFWMGPRNKRCDSLGLSIPEVVTLASVIEKETAKNDEKKIIAGVYMNRLRKHIPLQADPTVIFSLNDYTIKRVLNEHLKIDSPYNTYKFAGLPPGPICLPSVSSIDAVLNYQPHQYLYFCAKDDLSGYHNFAISLAEHNRNAKKYQEAMNKLNIK